MLSAYLYTRLEELLRENPRAKTLLEIGTWQGEGIAKLARMFPDKIFLVIDPFIEDGNTNHISLSGQGDKLEKNREKFLINTCGLENIILFEVTTADFIDEMNIFKNILPEIDIILIDGSHSYECVKKDLELVFKLATKNDLYVLMDDCTKDGVKKAIDEIDENTILTVERDIDTFLFYVPTILQ